MADCLCLKGDTTSTQAFGTGTVPASDPNSKFTDFKEFTEMIPKRHRQMQSVIFSDIKHQRIMWMENCGYWILSHAMTERTDTL